MSSLKVVVSKFGGSSMKDASAILRSAKIAADHKSSLVVVSATYGTTNQLIELSKIAQTGPWEKSQSIIDSIKENHRSIASDLKGTSDDFEVIDTGQGYSSIKRCSFESYGPPPKPRREIKFPSDDYRS
jgi:aspartate kinase